MDENIKREIILEHYQNPLNRVRHDENDYDKINSANQSCIDNIDIYVKIEDDVIKDISFEGEACAISISSTSIMIENLIGKMVSEALEYIDNFEKMINEKEYDKDILKGAFESLENNSSAKERA